MSALTFTTRTGAALGRLRESNASLPDGGFLTVCSSTGPHGRVELSVCGSCVYSNLSFTPDQARALAAELLACADARVAVQGGA